MHTIPRHAFMRGLTLVELMIALAVLGIMLTIGVPALSQVVNQNRLTSQANLFVGLVTLTRSEAVKRRTDVSLIFVHESGNWTGGLQVREGANNPNGTLIRQAQLANDFFAFGVIDAANLPAAISFNAVGQTDNSISITFYFQHNDCKGDLRREITVSPLGNLQMERKSCAT
ncbi:GspH/FimT family pseudopilin [Thiorhodospira sibirica]|uniref:GspH/FimT family pseudopilin n=1 Tax=Thiorhodospira sibirica TaxID=154347 RepID=UPI00022C0B36|nr:GspH/FimT family pseudopilin [Thiorhodospira sibirica]